MNKCDYIHDSYIYFYHLISSFKSQNNRLRILDLGCGDGTLVEFLRSRDIDCIGADIFQGNDSRKEIVKKKGLLGSVVYDIYDDAHKLTAQSFDIIITNQVIEHVEDLPDFIFLLDRIIVKGGLCINIFPTRETWIERHVNVPALHRIKMRSTAEKYTFLYLLLKKLPGILRLRINLRDIFIEANSLVNYVFNYTTYRSISKIEQDFSASFSVGFLTKDYLHFKLSSRFGSIIDNRIIRILLINFFTVYLFSRLHGIVLVVTK
jgi:SAM-dependent methyltransferase